MAGGVAAGRPRPGDRRPPAAGPPQRSLGHARGWYRGRVDVEEPECGRASRREAPRPAQHGRARRRAARRRARRPAAVRPSLVRTRSGGRQRRPRLRRSSPSGPPSGFAIDAGLRITNDRHVDHRRRRRSRRSSPAACSCGRAAASSTGGAPPTPGAHAADPRAARPHLPQLQVHLRQPHAGRHDRPGAGARRRALRPVGRRQRLRRHGRRRRPCLRR